MSDSAPLLFIDTNIFLDFYRATGSADFKLLDRLKTVKDGIITTHQVEMEFQKNRLGRMAEAFDKLDSMRCPEIPGMFVGTPELDDLNEAIKHIKKKLKILQDQLTGAVVLPAEGDPVYRAAKEIFSLESPLNLTRSKPEYPRVLRLARRRFMLGNPPRKEKDTSMGDAVNWEWIIECATASKRSVIVVSRDGDYGLSFDKQKHLNGWLYQEFIERVGSNNIKLTDSLSTALKEANVRVTKAEQEAEEKLITATTTRGLASGLDEKFWDSVKAAWPKNLPLITGSMYQMSSPSPFTIPMLPGPIAPNDGNRRKKKKKTK